VDAGSTAKLDCLANCECVADSAVWCAIVQLQEWHGGLMCTLHAASSGCSMRCNVM
jgi:hypothetical protein